MLYKASREDIPIILFCMEALYSGTRSACGFVVTAVRAQCVVVQTLGCISALILYGQIKKNFQRFFKSFIAFKRLSLSQITFCDFLRVFCLMHCKLVKPNALGALRVP